MNFSATTPVDSVKTKLRRVQAKSSARTPCIAKILQQRVFESQWHSSCCRKSWLHCCSESLLLQVQQVPAAAIPGQPAASTCSVGQVLAAVSLQLLSQAGFAHCSAGCDCKLIQGGCLSVPCSSREALLSLVEIEVRVHCAPQTSGPLKVQPVGRVPKVYQRLLPACEPERRGKTSTSDEFFF